jgi:tetratricopeptide (TPR) repeat protein
MSLSMKPSRALLAPRAVFRLLRARDLRLILLALSLLACAALSTLATPASAQHAPALPPGYTELIDEAVAEATRANFIEARALFARAHALYPNARTLRGLGMMSYELRSYAESVSYYEQALTSNERPLDADLRRDAEGQLNRARRFVAELKFALTPPATRVSVDGAPAQLGASGLLRLDPGQHTLLFEAAGYRSETRSLNVRGGESLVWTIMLPLAGDSQATQPDEPNANAALAAPAAQRDDKPRPLVKNPWLWAGVVLAAGAIAAGVAVAVTRDDKKTVQEAPTRSEQTPDEGVIFTLLRGR